MLCFYQRKFFILSLRLSVLIFKDEMDPALLKLFSCQSYTMEGEKTRKGCLFAWKVVSCKSLSCVYLSLEKLVNRKHFPVKEKFGLIFRKIFSFYFRWKTLFRSCEKFKNIILFADYIKFGLQTFDWYIFCLNIFFLISSLKFWFNLIFILTLVLIFMIFICFSLIFF